MSQVSAEGIPPRFVQVRRPGLQIDDQPSDLLPAQIPKEWLEGTGPYFDGDPTRPMTIAVLAEGNPDSDPTLNHAHLIPLGKKLGYDIVFINAKQLQEPRDPNKPPKWKNLQLLHVPGSWPRRYQYVQHTPEGHQPATTQTAEGIDVALPEFHGLITSYIRSTMRDHPMFSTQRHDGCPTISNTSAVLMNFFADKGVQGAWAKRHGIKMSHSCSIGFPISDDELDGVVSAAWTEMIVDPSRDGLYVKPQRNSMSGRGVEYITSADKLKDYLKHASGPILLEADDSRFWPDGHAYDWRVVVTQKQLPSGKYSEPLLAYAVIRTTGGPERGPTNIGQGGLHTQIALDDVPQDVAELALLTFRRFVTSHPFDHRLLGMDIRGSLPTTGPAAVPVPDANQEMGAVLGEINAYPGHVTGTNYDDLRTVFAATSSLVHFDAAKVKNS